MTAPPALLVTTATVLVWLIQQDCATLDTTALAALLPLHPRVSQLAGFVPKVGIVLRARHSQLLALKGPSTTSLVAQHKQTAPHALLVIIAPAATCHIPLISVLPGTTALEVHPRQRNL